MASARSFLAVALLSCCALAGGSLLAQNKDVFSFIPQGGRTLLAGVVASHPPADELQAILTGKHTLEEWVSYLQGKKKTIQALQPLSDQELLTLADYLSFNMPLASGQTASDILKSDAAKTLPPDGRDFVLDKCQGCHIITVVITQVRAKEAWLGTMNKPSHTRIKLSREQREALASFLVIDGGIPIDDVPKELRAGGATY